MSLYGYTGVDGNEGSRQSQTLYSSLGSSKRPSSKLFDMSMDDIDDISDLENMNFTQFSRTAGMQQARDSQSEFGSNPSFYDTASSSGNRQSTAETKSKSSDRGLSFENEEPYSSQEVSPQQTKAAAAAESEDNRDSTRYFTPATNRESQLGPEMTTKVKFSPDDETESHAIDTAAAAANAGPKPATASASHSDANGAAAAETPAFKLPLVSTQRSTVTSRWKRRGRLGLAKPKRNDQTMAIDDSGQGGGEEEDNTTTGMGLARSPPRSLDFFSTAPASTQDRLPFASRLTRSPPRSYGSAYSGIDGSDANSQKRSLYTPVDETSAADIDHTFQKSRVPQTNSGPWGIDGAAETREVGDGAGGLQRKRTANSSYEVPIHRQSLDVSDVSMTSNHMSRSQSPDHNSNGENGSDIGKIPSALAADSAPRPSASIDTGSVGKRSHESKVSFDDSVPKEPASSGSARRSARSPLLGNQHRPFISSSNADSSGSPESLNQIVGREVSPDIQKGSFAGRNILSTRGGSALSSFSLGAKQEKRSSAHGDSAMEISTRFQQYERRMNSVSPAYVASRDSQRGSSSAPRSSEPAVAASGLGSGEDAGPTHEAAHGSVESKSNYLHRAHSAPRGDRAAERHHAFDEYGADHRGAGYVSPKLSARRGVLNTSFDSLGKSTPVVSVENRQPESTSNSKSSLGSKPRKPIVSAFSVPAEQNNAELQNQHVSAVVQAEPMKPYAESYPKLEVDSQPNNQYHQQQQQQHVIQTSERPPDSQFQSQQQQQSSSRNGADPKRSIAVNGRIYQKISITGRGGSSKVYKAMSAKHEIFAIKRVSFSRADVQAIEGYVNEIILLRKFDGNPQIVQLFDAEINKERGILHMVMEFGETDLASVLKRQGDRPLGMNVIRLYWEQMLRAVQTIHEERVVHADLKPANYLLVKGSLKLIDFGIAKAIGNDTTNIHRENQIGTVNYMSPEAIKETNSESGKRLMKLGKASDIWSLGIILYQMCYGRTPFAQLALFKKLASIPDPTFVIPYPQYMSGCLQVGTERDPNADSNAAYSDGTPKIRVPPELLRVMQVCLQRDPSKRMSIPDLLIDPLLCPISLEHALPSAMAQMLTLLKHSPHVLEQWGISDSQNERVIASLVRTLHDQEQQGKKA
ncbi:Dual-specificity kinase, spindle pole body (SPB) duplication and spindle checkpoint function [Coemansia sp. RSA 2049]|nr:Dual-specificity kinase, spindle pole body (SPB) duplication and spindle checkpoint function [Coemansia sp. RSA 2049]